MPVADGMDAVDKPRVVRPVLTTRVALAKTSLSGVTFGVRRPVYERY